MWVITKAIAAQCYFVKRSNRAEQLGTAFYPLPECTGGGEIFTTHLNRVLCEFCWLCSLLEQRLQPNGPADRVIAASTLLSLNIPRALQRHLQDPTFGVQQLNATDNHWFPCQGGELWQHVPRHPWSEGSNTWISGCGCLSTGRVRCWQRLMLIKALVCHPAEFVNHKEVLLH